MRNFVQHGQAVTLTAPEGGVSAGDGFQVGALFGVASTDALEGEDFECALTGVFDLPKAAGDVGVGDPLYWDNAVKKITLDGELNLLVGVAVAAAATSAAQSRVRLNGMFGVEVIASEGS